jgi:ribosome-associated heat shock protein Hsp15
MESTRVDVWLWSVRIYKSRSAATDACRGGHVKVNGAAAKPAHVVRVGDRVTAYAHGLERALEVVRVIDKRVGAPIAAECLIDHSPPLPPREFVPRPMFRDPATGRPTKRERRQLDRFRRQGL